MWFCRWLSCILRNRILPKLPLVLLPKLVCWSLLELPAYQGCLSILNSNHYQQADKFGSFVSQILWRSRSFWKVLQENRVMILEIILNPGFSSYFGSLLVWKLKLEDFVVTLEHTGVFPNSVELCCTSNLWKPFGEGGRNVWEKTTWHYFSWWHGVHCPLCNLNMRDNCLRTTGYCLWTMNWNPLSPLMSSFCRVDLGTFVIFLSISKDLYQGMSVPFGFGSRVFFHFSIEKLLGFALWCCTITCN